MALEQRTTASKGRIALVLVIAVAVIVGVLLALQAIGSTERENVYGETQAGADLTPDASAAPPEGAEGAAGIVTPPPDAAAPPAEPARP